MRRDAVIGAAAIVTCVVGVLVCGALAPAKRTFTTAIAADQPMGEVRPLGRLCQGPISVPAHAAFSSIGTRLSPVRRGGPRPSVGVEIRSGAERRVIARGRLAAGWPAAPALVRIDLDRTVPDASAVLVCFTAVDDRPYFVWGSPTASPTPEAVDVRADRQIGGRLALSFFRSSGTRLSELPVVFERMMRFRPPWLGTWYAWVVAAALVLLAPLGLAWSLLAAARPDR